MEIVAELEIGGSPVHGGVQSQRKIGHSRAVAGAGDDLQIGKQYAVVQCAGALTHAAADGVGQAVAGVGGGGLVALFRRALAQRVVVGEGFSRLNDDPVEGFAEQAQIGIAVFIVAVLRLAGAENIPEINGISQNFRLHERHGNGDGFPGSGLRQRRFRRVQIEGIAVGAGDEPVFRHVEGIVNGRGADFIVNGIQVQLRGGGFRRDVHGDAVFSRPAGGHGLTVSPQNLVTGAVHVQMRFGNAHGQFQRLAGGAGVVVFRAEVGGIAGEGVVGVAEFCVKLAGIALQRGADKFGVYAQIGTQIHVAGERAVGTTHAVGIVHGGADVHLNASVGGGEGNGFHGQRHRQVFPIQRLVQSRLKGFSGLPFGHAANVHPGDGDAVGHPAVIGVEGGADKKETDRRQRQNQHANHSHRDDSAGGYAFLRRIRGKMAV